MQENQLDMAQQRKGRMVLILMVVFFTVPILAVVVMFKFNWTPSGESYGELVRQPKAIVVDEQQSSANTLSPLLWKEKWSLVYISADCDERCMKKLHEMRQLHASLYKDMVRVQRVLVTKKSEVSDIKKTFPDLIIIHQPQAVVELLSAQFQHDGENVEVANRLYLVDPLGFYMMSYTPNIPPAQVRKDVVKLLKSSWAG